jgi:hypothetical protein
MPMRKVLNHRILISHYLGISELPIRSKAVQSEIKEREQQKYLIKRRVATGIAISRMQDATPGRDLMRTKS